MKENNTPEPGLFEDLAKGSGVVLIYIARMIDNGIKEYESMSLSKVLIIIFGVLLLNNNLEPTWYRPFLPVYWWVALVFVAVVWLVLQDGFRAIVRWWLNRQDGG